jgi:nucleoid-associated protein YgaU
MVSTYTIESENESIWDVAEKTLGDRQKFIDIYALNRQLLGRNPTRLRPGQTLQIPDQQDLASKRHINMVKSVNKILFYF